MNPWRKAKNEAQDKTFELLRQETERQAREAYERRYASSTIVWTEADRTWAARLNIRLD